MLCDSLFVQGLAKVSTEIKSSKIVFVKSGIQSSVNMSMALSQENNKNAYAIQQVNQNLGLAKISAP